MEGTNISQQNNETNTQGAQGGIGAISGGISFDYEKLASVITGKQAVAEDTVLKNYFKQQGLSQEEMNQAINAFKTEKAKNTPNAAALQTQLENANKALLQANIDKQATLEAYNMGLDAKVVPHVLKLAELDKAVGEDGNINTEEIQKAIKKVLDDVPAFKGTNSDGNNNIGGFKIGGNAGATGGTDQETMLLDLFGIKK